jgi:hypothetical protein
MQRVKRCPESPSLCWTMIVVLLGLSCVAVFLFIEKLGG